MLVALFLVGAVAASAQQPAFTCNASAIPHQVRSEGLTELGGDIILNCSGGTATAYGAVVPLVNVQIFTNTQITSKRLVDNFNDWTEALLAIDDPGPAQQKYCTAISSLCTNLGNGAGLPIQQAFTITTNSNVFQGQIVGSNSLLWLGIPLDPPGTSGTRVIRITNVRVNANALGVADLNATPNPIIAVVTATGPMLAGVNNPTQTFAFIQRGLNFSLTEGIGDPDSLGLTSLQQCVSADKTVIGALNYTEIFATAFKRSGSAITDPPQNIFWWGRYTESGFQPAGYPQPADTRGDPNTAGDATQGTRVQAVFHNVPNGVTLWVSLYSGHASTQPASGEFFAAIGGASDAPWLKLTPVANTASAVWENFNSNPTASSIFQFLVAVSYTASPATNSPAPGTASVSGSYAPISTVTSATTGPVPRFADTSTATNIFTVIACAPTVTFASTRQMVQQFAGSGLIDNAGVTQSLLAHLAASESALQRGEARAARNILNAMANLVRAQAGKHVDPAAASSLLEAIGALASAIAP